MTNQSRTHDGFSLVELSIVLVILGLLTGGILGGQALMHAAELRSVTTEQQQYATAVQTFRSKYLYLPGDLPNAIQFWGGPPADCINTPTTDGTTCNGDGDGTIDYDNGSYSNTYYEGLRAWQHLANAGLITGTYTGADAVAGAAVGYAAGQNVPVSKFPKGIWTLFTHNAASGWAPNYTTEYISISGINSGNLRWHYDVMSTEDAWNIDTKVDDGRPFQGSVQGIKTYTPNCTDVENASGAYDLAYSGMACMLFFRL